MQNHTALNLSDHKWMVRQRKYLWGCMTTFCNSFVIPYHGVKKYLTDTENDLDKTNTVTSTILP